MAKKNEFPSKGDQKFEFYSKKKIWIDFTIV
jgi:hypothetical protein